MPVTNKCLGRAKGLLGRDWECDVTLELLKRRNCLVRQEEGLRAALLLEQAALCLLRVAPPALRKFAFHMVLAGLRYSSCGQGALGARAYRCDSRIACDCLPWCCAWRDIECRNRACTSLE